MEKCAYEDHANLEIAGATTLTAINVEAAHEEALKMNAFCDKFDAEHKNDDIVKDWAYASLLNAQIDLWADAAKPSIHS